jgi:2-desacetyl-2-hydroxyethyl bacteriochlorophyllide A dehydrogenase
VTAHGRPDHAASAPAGEAPLRARALQFVAPRRVELQDVALPDLGPGELLVRTEYSGISGGTEMLAYRGEIDPELALDETLEALGGTFTYPFPYGYSAVGRVERSRGDLAEGSLVFAFHPHQDRFAVAEEDVVALDHTDPRSGVLLPLVETALQASLDAGAAFGDHVVVLGLGCVGILTGALIARAGADVVGSEPCAQRRAAAAAFGLEAVAPEEVAGAVAQRTRRRGADLVVEATGSPAALGAGLDLLAHEGTALVLSWYGTKPVALPLGGAFHRRRLTIRSTQVSTIPARLSGRWDRARRRAAAAALLDDLPLGALTSHAFAFEEAPDAYAAVDRQEPGLIHAALRYA